MVNRSKSTKCKQFVAKQNNIAKSPFNRDFFSIYDGIVEGIDIQTGTLTVRVPSLDNSLYENCRIMLPCSTEASAVYPNFKVNSSVILGFKQFSLAYPIVLGATISSTVNIPITENAITMVNGTAKITINENEIILTNGTSTITIGSAGISLTGPSIDANGENLLDDDIGDL